MGKGSRRRQHSEKYDKVYAASPIWEGREEKKQTECWKCKMSWKCENAYQSKTCIEFKEKHFESNH